MVYPAPPPTPPSRPQFPTPSYDSSHRGPPSSSSGYNPSLFIIAAILSLVIIASAAIHLLLRCLSRPSSSSSSSTAPAPLIRHSHSGSPSASAASSVLSEKEKATLIESLPLFSLASSVVMLPKSSPDCAVCLSPFQPHDELRLLPGCRHVFHSPCIDTWLRSTPSCPLCRSSITLPVPPLPPLPPAADAADNPSRSSSFRIEIGSVSRRRLSAELDPAGAGTSLPNPPSLPPHLRSYSLGSSFEYVVDEEVEAVVARIRRAKEDKAEPAGPPPPGEQVAEAAGGGARNWLREYVDRLTSPASSSFSSLRFSGRWSHRYDDGGGGGGRDSWDLEGNYQEGEVEESSYYTFYRWLVGA